MPYTTAYGLTSLLSSVASSLMSPSSSKRDRLHEEGSSMDSTAVLDPAPEPVSPEPLSKRRKRAPSGQGKDARFHQTYDIAMGRLGLSPSPTGQESSAPKRRKSQKSEDKTDSGKVEVVNTGPVLRKNKRPSLRLRMAQLDAQDQQPQPTSSAIASALDFSQAPTTPSDFIEWIAGHITQMRSSTSPSANMLSSGLSNMTSVMRPLKTGDGSNDQSESMRERVKERQKLENRERKKRWRETNAERNKDNDLRCRVNKIAKEKFGPENSEEKMAFIEREFTHRRFKRIQKELAGMPYRIQLPPMRSSVDSARHLKDSLRESLSDGKTSGVEAIGRQLIDMLVDSEGQQISEETLKAAASLRANITVMDSTGQAIEEAMRILAENDELVKELEAGLHGSPDLAVEAEHPSEGEDSPNVVTNGQPSSAAAPKATNGVFNGTQATHNTAAPKTPLTESPMAAEGPIERPLSARRRKPTERKTASQEQAAAVAAATAAPRRSKPKRKRTDGSTLLDPSSIDAFLALANGGLDSSDEDEAEAPANYAATSSAAPTTADAVFDQVLEKVAESIMARRFEDAGRGIHGRASDGINGKPFSKRKVRDEVQELKRLLSDSGASVNTLMPASQAQALSKFHSQLRRFIEAEVGPTALQSNGYPDGEVYGRMAMANGDSKGKRATRYAKPTLVELAALYVSAVPTAEDVPADKPNSGVSAEEERKIQTYGFPPLPGQGFVSRRNTEKGR